ncbi:C4-dicarboxylate ABC transporter substrate-binding protein [Aquibium sp. A9E412]|uniref:C4-dicarboxylate ABC transporter substrate-binding protein n=1 Tax=Aquibium sp. A9E412 TaxID=2976767 RepID=UPI0025AF51C9|nr:C4-dicarboxylate ABC transporter substrate-binding protein [Aquibium sp. A9E412]MDN2567122.1 C4-dicarboxylate ABC transporter substrate-binding protein [Aquibium sp. A9E412]
MKQWISAALVATVTAAAAVPALAQEEEPIVWRMSSYAGETWGLWKNIVVPFTERVNELADGRLVIEPYPVDVLAPATKNYEAVLDGTADAAMITPLYAVNADPANTFYAGHPGGMGPETLIHWLYEGGGQELLTEFKRDTLGLHSLVGGVVGTELWHSHKPIESVSDLEGLKFRAAGSWASILAEEFNAAPVFVTGAEVYQMLDRGGVDIAEWSGPADNQIAGLQNAAEYILAPGLHFPAGINEFIVKAEAWDALPDDLKQIVTSAAKLAVFESYLQSGMGDIVAMQELRAGNNKFEELPAEVTEAITEAGRSWAAAKAEEQTEAGNAWMKKIGDSYFAFQDLYADGASYKHVDRD